MIPFIKIFKTIFPETIISDFNGKKSINLSFFEKNTYTYMT